MPWTSDHIPWLTDQQNILTTADGHAVTVLEFQPDRNDQAVISAWAKHFRNHYTFDTEIDDLRRGTGLDRKEFLMQLKFPTDGRGFGPAVRAGDFGEILVADYLEFVLNHVVPRTRYGTKTVQDESTKGSDTIGFLLHDEHQTPQDILTVIEAKAQFSGTAPKARLQDAIDGSVSDPLRLAESLNAMKQRLYDKGEKDQCALIERFQDKAGKPYQSNFGAAALFTNAAYGPTAITDAHASVHPHQQNLFLILIKGDDLMDLVNHLYEIAADEA
jgi:hypothetical protein